jgi:glyoxylase-like metal-dependent hydrolase (beta-lactamase superfamily II)
VVVGSVELVPIVDAVGELGTLEELFPEFDGWEQYRELYPSLFREDRWLLPAACYLVRSGGTTVLVDTGVGPAGLWGWDADREEGLLPGLEAAGVARDDVDVVFLTHLHIDHVGWNTDREGQPVFLRARFIAHQEALAFARGVDRPHIQRCILPLEFEDVAGEIELAAGITAIPLPGHYPGHMGLRIESGGDRALLIADVAVHPAMLDEPELLYVSDVDPAVSAATRRELLAEIVDDDVLVVCGHYPDGGIGRVVSREGRVAWEPA